MRPARKNSSTVRSSWSRKVWGAEHLGELSLLRVAFARIRRKLSEAGADGSVISSYSGVGYVITDLSESFD